MNLTAIRDAAGAVAAGTQTPAVVPLTALAFLSAWQLIGMTGSIFAELFPPITEIIKSLWLYLTTPILIPHLYASLYEVLGGLLVGSLFGIPLESSSAVAVASCRLWNP